MPYDHVKNNYSQNNKDKIALMDKDLIRNLIVKDKTAVITEEQFNKIKLNSNAISNLETTRPKRNDVNTLIEEEQKKQDNLKREIDALKISRVSNEMDEEEKLAKERILARTKHIKQEQEDIVKRCNSLILSVKCKAIQDAQIAEKETIKSGFKQHENVIDHRMEEERLQAIQELQRKREQEWANKRKYAESILNQIRDKEKLRSKHLRELHREFKLLKLKAEQQTSDDQQNSKRNSHLQLEIKKQNQRINEQIKQEREVKQKEEKLENMKIQELVKRKLEEERKMDRKKKKEKQLRERELARLWSIQKGSTLLREVKDDMLTERIHEKLQRKWRATELETARQKQREIEEVKRARDQQVQQKREVQISLLEEKKKEAEKIIKENETFRNEILQIESIQKQVIDRHKKALQEQITEKEMIKKKQHDNELKARENLWKQIRQYQEETKEVVKQKIDEMRKHNVPRSYIAHLLRQVDLLN